MGLKPAVVTTDGSNHSLRILPHAALLAQATSSPLQLLRVIEDGDINTEPGEDAAAARARTESRDSDELRAHLQEAGVDGTARVEFASAQVKAADAILAAVEDALLLAMHSRGKGGLSLLLQGSVTLRVLERVELPVLLGGPELLAPARRGDVYRIVATSDLSADSQDVLRALSSIVSEGNFEVTLLFVHERAPADKDNDAELRQAEATLNDFRALMPESTRVDVLVRDIPRGGGVDTAILEEARRVGANAIAISTHGQSARKTAIAGSTTTSVLGRSTLPLIVARV